MSIEERVVRLEKGNKIERWLMPVLVVGALILFLSLKNEPPISQEVEFLTVQSLRVVDGDGNVRALLVAEPGPPSLRVVTDEGAAVRPEPDRVESAILLLYDANGNVIWRAPEKK